MQNNLLCQPLDNITYNSIFIMIFEKRFKEECMKKEFLEEMKTELYTKKREVVEILASEYNSFQATNNIKGKDLVDLASNDLDKQILDFSSAMEVKTLNKINSAITRMKNECYGVCSSCGHLIGEARLKAMPYAVLCVGCKTKRERAKR